MAELETQPDLELPRKRGLLCAVCGYGILRATPPERCPMCQVERTWVDAPAQPFLVLSTR